MRQAQRPVVSIEDERLGVSQLAAALAYKKGTPSGISLSALSLLSLFSLCSLSLSSLSISLCAPSMRVLSLLERLLGRRRIGLRGGLWLSESRRKGSQVSLNRSLSPPAPLSDSPSSSSSFEVYGERALCAFRALYRISSACGVPSPAPGPFSAACSARGSASLPP